jgi:hypothetical protein
MKERFECLTMAEFDECICAGNIAVVFGLSVVTWGNSRVEAWENSSVEAWGHSSVVARENARVDARGNALVEARDNAIVEAWGNAIVEARGNVFIRLYSAQKITATPYVTIVKHGTAATLEGGRQLDAEPEDADANGVAMFKRPR